MDETRFDNLTRTLQRLASRRAALKAAGASGLAASLAVLGRDAEAKKKKKNKKKGPKCAGNFLGCANNASCCSQNCCTTLDNSDRFCVSKVDIICCPPEIRGGCDPEFPTCCPPDSFEEGFCCRPGRTCCEDSDGFGYCCPPETPVCCEDDEGFGSCCEADSNRVATARSGGSGREERRKLDPLN
jgi:hypothetical protein